MIHDWAMNPADLLTSKCAFSCTRFHVYVCACARVRAHILCLCGQQLHQMLELYFRSRGHELKHGEPSWLMFSSTPLVHTQKRTLDQCFGCLSKQPREYVGRKKHGQEIRIVRIWRKIIRGREIKCVLVSAIARMWARGRVVDQARRFWTRHSALSQLIPFYAPSWSFPFRFPLCFQCYPIIILDAKKRNSRGVSTNTIVIIVIVVLAVFT